MKAWVFLISLFSALAHSSPNLTTYEYEATDSTVMEEQRVVCESVVCNSLVEKEVVPNPGDAPVREGNKTIETLTNAMYIVGEIGLAENLSTADEERFNAD
ncbi:hypothetical protein [Vibrio sp. 10N.261.55.A7]|uniref:hypothetical protein n=1 Tax=Vibrio sp. 10N.261.55.A7 TaxID=1880851 RepID=UPI000C826328|nr:hypothetical protein [Vibrio sp. 10N.261.55.A7]PMJ99088.1 hypothetical protein BCU12_03765 [Vibrio sp. 10N.261.55.A7]